MSIEAMKLALEALEFCVGPAKTNAAITVLRQAIEQENEFNPDWNAMAVMVEEQQRVAKRIEELEQERFCDNNCVWTDHHPDCVFEKQEPKCNPHPKAPHGFSRNGSHANDRYTCDCEGWDAYEAGYQAGVIAGIEASMDEERKRSL